MRFDPVKVALFDAVVSGYLTDNPEFPERFVLEQDVYMGSARRALLAALVMDAGWKFLDAGCGFGIVPLDLAGQMSVEAHGLDTDPAKLMIARELQSQLADQGHPAAGSTVSFEEGDLASTPYDDGTFDFVLASFVYQYLSDPEGTTDELYRVTKPGGLVCLVDADDGISLVYPEPSDAYSTLSDAFARRQELAGGDRNVGRKLASFLDGSGFEVISTLIQPAAEYRAAPPDDPGRQFLLDRLTEARGDIVDQAILTAEDFDRCLKLLADEGSVVQYRTNAQLIAVGRRPAG